MIGVVMQDDILFQGTVADNVSFFDSPIDFERVARAARQANVAAEIEAMPMRYHSMLAEAADRHLRRPEAAPLHRPRALSRAARPLPRRGDEPPRRRQRGAGDPRRQGDGDDAVLVAHRKETIAIADRVVAIDPLAGTVRDLHPPSVTAHAGAPTQAVND